MNSLANFVFKRKLKDFNKTCYRFFFYKTSLKNKYRGPYQPGYTRYDTEDQLIVK